jgi:transposase
MAPLRKRVEDLLAQGGSCGDKKTASQCREILRFAPALWTFVRVEGVEPTNNASERAIRGAVLWRKGSFGTHSASGSRFVERMLTVSVTLRQQGRNVVEFVRQACEAARTGEGVPSLLPAEATIRGAAEAA